MALVKVRRVGNSSVMTLPAGLGGHGFHPGPPCWSKRRMMVLSE